MPDLKTGEILDGKAVAMQLQEKLKDEVESFRKDGKRPPGLAVVLVGDNPASELYVRNKISACKKVGIDSVLERLEKSATTDEIIEVIEKLNCDQAIDGILVQLPLPDGLEEKAILDCILPGKDVDGLHPYNLGCLLAGAPGLRPCTPSGIIILLEHYQVPLAGANAVVVGRSKLVGKPAALLLMEKNATVTICHSRTKNLEQLIGQADIVVVAIGKSQFVKGSWIRANAVVVDVGIHYDRLENGKRLITGDVEFDSARKVARLITPVPGGVGPMTVAQLLANTLMSYKSRI
ncbi:MAG: bifunctional methylenetetrahydrofolate dehydrogenase/methenyltetrahydrofolate cyclohydrolase FolD [Candidatus Obscuribacterales bacterium]|nr:bifunctional methylenetetrahydrofolate dehydrogenase/methenyltetrahydrofolate cyclohydrolase FolD [Candidatus Obscuribacterales bacterium]